MEDEDEFQKQTEQQESAHAAGFKALSDQAASWLSEETKKALQQTDDEDEATRISEAVACQAEPQGLKDNKHKPRKRAIGMRGKTSSITAIAPAGAKAAAKALERLAVLKKHAEGLPAG